KQFVGLGCGYWPCGAVWDFGSPLDGWPGAARAGGDARNCNRRPGFAPVPGHELLVAFSGCNRRLAQLAAAEHFFARRSDLDFGTAHLAYHDVPAHRSVAPTRTFATRERSGARRLAIDSRTFVSAWANRAGASGGGQFHSGAE